MCCGSIRGRVVGYGRVRKKAGIGSEFVFRTGGIRNGTIIERRGECGFGNVGEFFAGWDVGASGVIGYRFNRRRDDRPKQGIVCCAGKRRCSGKRRYNVKAERDRENGIPIFRVEFETDYGDYAFEISVSDGRIVGADYEVDEEWLDRLGGAPVTPEEAKNIVRSKVPGSEAGDVRIRKEGGDGRGRFEGELFYAGMKYEFEMDPNTGIIFDWNADLRE